MAAGSGRVERIGTGHLKTRERLEQTRAHGGHDSKIILVRSI